MKKSLLALAVFAGFSLCASAADPVTSLNENFANGIPETWTNVAVSGDQLFFEKSYSGTFYASASGYKGTNPPYNEWLISPAVDIDKAAEKVLTFRTQVNSYGNTTDTFKAYVLTSNDPETATATELPATFAVAPETGYSSWAESGNLDLSAYKGTIYIGFNYVAVESENYCTWCVTDVKLNASDASGEKGSLDAPLSIDDLLSINCPGKESGEAGWYVKGYIVGYVTGMSIDGAVFGASGDEVSDTNILLGGSSAEDDVTACIPVQLPKGMREELSLKSNPGNLGKQIILCGTYEKYFSVPGLKNLTSYKFVDGSDPNPGPTPSTGAIYNGLVNNADDFTFSGTADYPADMENKSVWAWDEKYGLVASAFFNNASYVSDVWAVSPVIDLAGYEKVSMTLSQAANKFKDHADYMANTKVCVREGEGEWTKLEITNVPDGNENWNFIDSEAISLNDFVGKKIQIGFNYVSTENGGGKWEIKNLTVTGETGIAAVDVEEGEAVYFNLQGMRVLNPENGLYIERRGNKARKVLIRK